METSSLLSSLNDECKSDNYIEPHYKEWYRVAVDTLIQNGLEAYQEFLAKERCSEFLAEEEINYILKNVQKFAQSTAHTSDNSCDDTSSSGTYWPVESDVEAPNLDLGWPYVMPGLLGGTHIDLLFHPPRAHFLTIKETIRKMIKEARKAFIHMLLMSLSQMCLFSPSPWHHKFDRRILEGSMSFQIFSKTFKEKINYGNDYILPAESTNVYPAHQ